MGLFSYGPSDYEYVKCRHCGKSIIESTQVCRYCNGTAPGIYTQCPTCGSNEYVWHNAGFSWIRAAVGAAAIGPLGLLNGAIGSTACECICLKCGQGWVPTGPNHGVVGTKTRKFSELPNDCYSITVLTVHNKQGDMVAVTEDIGNVFSEEVRDFIYESLNDDTNSTKHDYNTDSMKDKKTTQSLVTDDKVKTFFCEQCCGIVYYSGNGKPTGRILCPKCKKKQKKQNKR